MCPPSEARQASWALERMADRMGIRIEKALDPLDHDDFVTISMRLASALRGAARGAEAAALKAALEALDVDWPSLSAFQRDNVVAAARTEIARMAAAAKPVSEVLSRSAESLVDSTRGATVRRYALDIISEPTKGDAQVADLLRRSQMVYIKDGFGRRADSFDAQAKEIVARGLERGLGRDDIGAELAEQLGAAQINRSRAYWELIAGDFANKSRTASQIDTFDEAGITTYRFEAVLDEVTTSICRMLHGTTWPVRTVKGQLDDVLALEDPEDIRDARPWVRNGREGDRDVLYIERNGQRSVVAEVLRSGVGTRDYTGSFKQEMSDADMLAAGITVPPLHGRCRSTIVVD